MTPTQAAAKVAANIRSAREAAGLNQSEAARLLGVSRSIICEYEGGRGRVPSAATYLRIISELAAHAAIR